MTSTSHQPATRLQPDYSRDKFSDDRREICRAGRWWLGQSNMEMSLGRCLGMSGIYNAMVNPLVRLPIKGSLWYQGESNGEEGDTYFETIRPPRTRRENSDVSQSRAPTKNGTGPTR